MLTKEKTRLIRWLLLEAEDINVALKIDTYEVYANKKELGLKIKWQEEHYQQNKCCESTGETNTHASTAEELE